MTRIQRAIAPAALSLVLGAGAAGQPSGSPALAALVPAVEGWTAAEPPRHFFPEDLYEYIDGAAESYLSYGFRELVVAEYARGEASLTIEIYDMGTELDAFGIFSAERYPENPPVAIGAGGYLEDEVLNFAAGRFYTKLLAFGAGEPGPLLHGIAGYIAGRTGGSTGPPAPFALFPAEGRVPRSEKFVRQNFLGFEFLKDGYTAAYEAGGETFEAFLTPAGSPAEAEALLGRLLEFFGRDAAPETTPAGRRVRMRSGHVSYFAAAGRHLCGVLRVPESGLAAGERAARGLAAALEKLR